jgi:formate-dependent nitrite reductase membrane component NrfD
MFCRSLSKRDMATWEIDWAWSLPLIVLTVVTQVLGLGVIAEWIVGRMSNKVKPRHLTPLFVVLMAAAALMVTVLLAFQGVLWAGAYRVVGALPDNRSAMLYSLSAITGSATRRYFLILTGR